MSIHFIKIALYFISAGGPGFSPYVMLEIHYNNPLRREGIIDSSGLKFKISKEINIFQRAAKIFTMKLLTSCPYT